MSEARLRQALQGSLDELMSVIGLPADAEHPYAARQRVDEVLIDRDHVPSSAWRAACYGMDILMIGLGVLEDGPPAVSVEDGLAFLLADRCGALAAGDAPRPGMGAPDLLNGLQEETR